MKKLYSLGLVLLLFLASCNNYNSGELVGVSGRDSYFEPDPFGMVFIPQGSFVMGPSDQDVAWAQDNFSRTVSVEAFWMDETEITNNEYRQFVHWVRDSIMRRMLGEQLDDYVITEDELGNPIDPPLVNWETEIDFRDEEIREILSDLYLGEKERFFGRKEIDKRKLMYEYFWVDLQQAANKNNRYDFETQSYSGFVTNSEGEQIEITDRSAFIIRDRIPVYPDTLCWIADFTYSFNEPLTTMYFWHPAYDNYPIVGITWKQASAFAIWRTQYLNNSLAASGQPWVHNYRLPLESEWEYAARGGLDQSMYPWGGLYTRNKQGCFLANFKPLRGNYADDGGLTTTNVGTYEPNEFGLYDMSGNVAEWCANAYDESASIFSHDLNPDYKYNARPEDPPALKRKVIRGGSWKDVAYFLQCGTRTYEYQDTSKSFVGFRCVRTYLGSNS
ncbi:MAG: SUMF1/EgtB/PvdO family nonheme iron enzyme [Bacteroidetes bacterium]|jgi:formylglycine-generating enzyme required for sulfatase activity|nr:SUMF1/EgtB/PvdO family nonheme iron enzyme [Bacteroidota bacterium]